MSVRLVPVADLADPANRLTIRYPAGQSGPAFRSGPMLIWGFTAMLTDEARLTSAIRHPNVVPVIDVLRVDNGAGRLAQVDKLRRLRAERNPAAWRRT